MDLIVCQACTDIHICNRHASSRLGHKHILPLAVLTEYAQETIVSGRFPIVIPFLGVTSDLIGVVKLESEKRIENLRGAKVD